jgi:hypothetical protein
MSKEEEEAVTEEAYNLRGLRSLRMFQSLSMLYLLIMQ